MNNQAFEYDFSIIMAVYNAEPYLREAMESLVGQTIGFDRIQVILVDDGSPDGCGKICDEYQARYPQNVLSLHKPNGGVSSARNLGLRHFRGKYVSFLDPDDKLEKKALAAVKAFMDRQENSVAVCAIPLVFFGNSSGDHILNYKFEKGSRVVELMDPENMDCIQLSASSTFIRSEDARSICFDERLKYAEDARELMCIFIRKPRLGLVADTKYYYRRHGESAVSKSVLAPAWYLPWLKWFVLRSLDDAQAAWGQIPKFVQFTIMYDMQWRLRQPFFPENILTEEEQSEFKELSASVLERIDDDVILAQKNLTTEYKVYALTVKYGHSPELVRSLRTGEGLLRFGDEFAVPFTDLAAKFEFFSLDGENGYICLEGFFSLCRGFEDTEISPYLLVNGRPVLCQTIKREKVHAESLGEPVAWGHGFRAEFSAENGELIIEPALLFGDDCICRTRAVYGKFFPVSAVYENMYALYGHSMLRGGEKGFRLVKRPAFPVLLVQETKLLQEIWNKNKLGGRKAVLGRIIYHLLRPFKRRQLWIVSDRITRADDNGEAFFRYAMEHKPRRTRILFAISDSSPDAARMRQIGPCVGAMSFRHKLLHLLCDVNISAQGDDVIINPFSGHDDALRDLLTHQRFVFLQHGVIKDDMSDWLNRYNKNLTGFVSSAVPEYESLKDESYAYPPDNIWLTGLPRFDRLYHNEQKKITVMPTWRKYLMDHSDPRTGEWVPSADFTDSSFYKFYDRLLNSERLLDALEKKGYTLQFFPHPNLRLGANGVHFRQDRRVAFLPNDAIYREIYAASSLVLTDYSSAVFDFAYLRKPIIYCQFDKEEFFSGKHMFEAGYFSYERDGFGEVEYDLEGTIDRILEYVERDCTIKDCYRARIDSFFAYNDRNNCKRVMEKILALPKP